MIRILFVCHGNICRSAAAQYVMQKLVKEAGAEDRFFIDSAGTSAEERGNPVYPPMERVLRAHDVPCGGHRARQITRRDGEDFDLLIGMDEANLRNLRRMFGGEKVSLLMDYTGLPREVADPWFTRGFEETYEDVLEGCRALLQFCLRKSGEA